jgi:hypothetical protein
LIFDWTLIITENAMIIFKKSIIQGKPGKPYTCKALRDKWTLESQENFKNLFRKFSKKRFLIYEERYTKEPKRDIN